MAKIYEAEDGSGFVLYHDGRELSVIEVRKGESKKEAWDKAAGKLRAFQEKELLEQKKEVIDNE